MKVLQVGHVIMQERGEKLDAAWVWLKRPAAAGGFITKHVCVEDCADNTDSEIAAFALSVTEPGDEVVEVSRRTAGSYVPAGAGVMIGGRWCPD